MRFSTKHLTPLAYAATIYGNVGTAIEISSSPVIWAESPKIKVTNKLGNIQFNVDLINPCDVLATLYHEELQKDAHQKCNQIYGDLVSNEIQGWCPQRNRKPKVFFIPILIGIGIVAALGLASYAAYTSHQNSESIIMLAENQNGQDKFMDALEKQIVGSHQKMDNFTEKYNKLVAKIKVLAGDFEQFKGTYVNTVFETSALVSKFTVKRMQIREVKRLWKESIVHPDIMDIFDFKMPCDEKNCPLNLAKPINCEMHGNDKVVMKLETPIVNPDFVVMKAFSFKLLVRASNLTCLKKYVGPQKMIMSRQGKCIVNSDYASQDEDRYGYINIASDYTCKENFEPATMYNITECVNSTAEDYKQFVQVKILNDKMLVYCPESNYSLNGITQECHDEIMVFPTTASLKVNGEFIFVNQVNITADHLQNSELHAVAEHTLTLMDKYDFSSTMFNQTDDFKQLNISDYITHPLILYGGPSLILIVLVLAAALVCYKMFFKNRNQSSKNMTL